MLTEVGANLEVQNFIPSPGKIWRWLLQCGGSGHFTLLDAVD